MMNSIPKSNSNSKSNDGVDIVVVGAGPVGLMCAYLGRLCGLNVVVLDKSAAPLNVGRADALNARSLQLLETVDLFRHLHPLGKPCNTSSVWADGRFVSRQSAWWDELEGCSHKHFLMLGQAFLERALDDKLREAGTPVRRLAPVADVRLTENGCLTTLESGETIASRFVIGADGSRSFVRGLFRVPFALTRPQMVWAVLDGVIESDFPKVPEIIAFQSDTADVAWIPREGGIDRFYVRMDTKEFTFDEALARIARAMNPHTLRFTEVAWFSRFSVKESVAERFAVGERVFLAGDACHVHSVNGGQGLNTGLGDAFNLIWKLHMVVNFGAPAELLDTYEAERKPVAFGVVETSAELVRSTKYSESGRHAEDYVEVVRRRAGYVTGMGIRYGERGLPGTRLFDFPIGDGLGESRIYSHLDPTAFTLLVVGETQVEFDVPAFVKVVQVHTRERGEGYWATACPYTGLVVLVRPDTYIAAAAPCDALGTQGKAAVLPAEWVSPFIGVKTVDPTWM